MKRILLSVIMLIGIPNFAADLQDSETSNEENLFFPENNSTSGLFGYIASIPGKLSRAYDVRTNVDTQKKMFGFDSYENGTEHIKTKNCVKYFREIAKTIPLTIAMDSEKINQKLNRIYVWETLAHLILSQREQNAIGDFKSARTIKNIDRLEEMADICGTPNTLAMLQSNKKCIQHQLSQAVQGKKSSLSEPHPPLSPASSTTPQPATPAIPGTPTTLPQSPNTPTPSTPNASAPTTPSATTANSVSTHTSAPAAPARTASTTNTITTTISGTSSPDTSAIKISQHFPH